MSASYGCGIDVSGAGTDLLSLDPALQRLVDHRAIGDVLARYCRGIDRRDFDLVRSCYHPDATDDHGTFKGTVEEFLAWVPGQLERFESTMHFTGTQLIEIDGDRAHAETYTVAYHRLKEAPARDSIAGLRYVDLLERRNGEWRLVERTVVVEWNRVDEVQSLGFHPDYVQGTHGGADHVFTTLQDFRGS